MTEVNIADALAALADAEARYAAAEAAHTAACRAFLDGYRADDDALYQRVADALVERAPRLTMPSSPWSACVTTSPVY